MWNEWTGNKSSSSSSDGAAKLAECKVPGKVKVPAENETPGPPGFVKWVCFRAFKGEDWVSWYEAWLALIGRPLVGEERNLL